MELFHSFTGQVLFAQSGNPISDIRIELSDSKRHILLGDAHTDKSGKFNINLDMSTVRESGQGTIQPVINLFKGITRIYTEEISSISQSQTILVHAGR